MKRLAPFVLFCLPWLFACTDTDAPAATVQSTAVQYGKRFESTGAFELPVGVASQGQAGSFHQAFRMTPALAQQLRGAKPGDAFDWPLPDGANPNWRVVRVEPQGQSALTVVAHADNDGHAIIGLVDANAVQARLLHGGEEWLFQTNQAGQTVAGSGRDRIRFAPPHNARAVPDALEAETEVTGMGWQQVLAQGRIRADARAATQRDLPLSADNREQIKADTNVQLDILFVVAPSLQRLYGSIAARDADVAMIIGIGNNALTTNGIAMRMRNAGVHELPSEVGEVNQIDLLRNLRDNVDVFTGIWPIQRDAGADMVSLLIPFRNQDVTDGNCGRGYVNSFKSGGTFGGRRDAYSVVSRLKLTTSSSFCFPSAFAHEIGHNLGLAHDRIGDPNGTAVYDYARGHTVPGVFRDVMGTGSPERLELYSDPLLTCRGQPCGIAEGSPNSADAARALRVTGPLQSQALDPRERFSGWYVVNGELGTGWAVEVQDSRMFAAYFHYTATGSATWVAGPGRECATNRFCVDLNEYRGGATAGGTYRAPSATVRLATATLTLNTQTALPSIDLVTGNRVQRLSRFNISDAADAFSRRSAYPNTHKPGWFWDSSAGGTGMFVEAQGEVSFVGYFHYRSDGSPTWLAARGKRYSVVKNAFGASTSSSSLSINFQAYEGGQTLTGPWRAPRETNANAMNGFLSVEQDYISISNSTGLRQSNRFVPFRDF